MKVQPAGSKKMPQDADIGQLIMKLNPYTMKAGQNGQMDIYTSNPAPASGGAANGTIPQVQLQIDDYGNEWTFGGQPQRVKRAIRILYRYPILDPANPQGPPLGWAQDYLLIGYQGSGGN